LKVVECLASCGTAPMMQVGNHFIENMSVEKMDSILEDLKKKHEVPAPDYGSPYPVGSTGDNNR
jgi:NADH-quinone oxidoreductase subunit E